MEGDAHGVPPALVSPISVTAKHPQQEDSSTSLAAPGMSQASLEAHGTEGSVVSAGSLGVCPDFCGAPVVGCRKEKTQVEHVLVGSAHWHAEGEEGPTAYWGWTTRTPVLETPSAPGGQRQGELAGVVTQTETLASNEIESSLPVPIPPNSTVHPLLRDQNALFEHFKMHAYRKHLLIDATREVFLDRMAGNLVQMVERPMPSETGVTSCCWVCAGRANRPCSSCSETHLAVLRMAAGD